jgi:hypothetical protein
MQNSANITGRGFGKMDKFLAFLGLAKLATDPAMPVNPNFAKHASGLDMEVAFESGGTKYFRFINEQRIPAMRAFAAKDVFGELQFRTTDEMHTSFLDAIMTAAENGKLGEVYELAHILKERKNNVTHVGLLYKLASVLYLDQSEDPQDYDPAYAYLKIQKWQADRDVNAFFLETPIIEYLPFSDLSKIDFNHFSKLERKIDLSHLTALSKSLQRGRASSESLTYLASQMEMLSNMIK